MLTWQKYDVAVDIWSAGCIFAEMLEGKPLFPGKDRKLHCLMLCIKLRIIWSDVNQFSIITELLGTPPDDVIATICSENVRTSHVPRCLYMYWLLLIVSLQTLRFVQSLPKRERVPFSQKLRCADDMGELFRLSILLGVYLRILHASSDRYRDRRVLMMSFV